MMTSVLITGVAGFIGSHLATSLLADGFTVFGIDNFTPNYNVEFKLTRIRSLRKKPNFTFAQTDIINRKKLEQVFRDFSPQLVIHFAALTGVRASFTNAARYFTVNVTGTENVFTAAATSGAHKLIFASSSSVYGNSKQIPFREPQRLAPLSPYAQSKQHAELRLKKLFREYQLPTMILRFFSVYGPEGRPDMAPYLFTEAAFKNKPIIQFGDGTTGRDFTYVHDVVRAVKKAATLDFTFDVINIGNAAPVLLNQLITTVEQYTGKKIHRVQKVANSYESAITYAHIAKAKKILGWQPQTSFASGMELFVDWFKQNRL